MKTIIHIGQHKTGTTSIQHFLRDKRKELISAGLYVPSMIAGYDSPSHFILNVYALNPDRFSSKKEEIIEERGWAYLDTLQEKLQRDIGQIYKNASTLECDKVLWTNEGLYLLNTEAEYARLKALFSGYSDSVEVVCCFRDVKSYRDSYICQLFKQHLTQSRDPDSYRYVGVDSWLFDYERKQALLAQVFDQYSYFDYDPEDNVRVFLEAIGCDVVGTQGYRKNVTVAPKTLRHKIFNRFTSLVN